MNGSIVHSGDPITLVGGGCSSLDDLALARKLGPDVVAADGGAALCLQAGFTPRHVIGDLDSLSDDLRNTLPADRITEISEQDSTDFDKVLRSCSAPLFLGVGFLGRRLDHQMAVLNRLVARPDKRIVLLGRHDVVFQCPPEIVLPVAAGVRVSLFPLRPVQGKSEGLEWPIDGIEMAPDARVGTSNRATGVVTLRMAAPGMIVMLPRAAFTLAANALRDAAHWPARAG